MTFDSSIEPTNTQPTKKPGDVHSDSQKPGPQTSGLQSPSPLATGSFDSRETANEPPTLAANLPADSDRAALANPSSLPQSLHDFFFDRLNYERQTAAPYSERTYRLQPIRSLLAELGNPHEIPVVHVAGTKGKGSVATLVQQTLVQAGYRVGLFTSPHVSCLTERFVVDNQSLTFQQLEQVVAELRPAVEKISQELESTQSPSLTFFDLCAAAAFVAFRQLGCDFAAIEVGLGGRLDSTNVVQPLVSIITNISFDHTAQLGNTLAKIASEKAGIIKTGVPVVSGVQAEEAKQVVAATTEQYQSQLWQLNDNVQWIQQSKTLESNTTPSAQSGQDSDRFGVHFKQNPDWDIAELTLNMAGLHQRDNASLAMTAIRILQAKNWKVSDDNIRRAFAETSVPGRIQIVANHPLTVLDAAHNPASFKALLSTLESLFHPDEGSTSIGSTTATSRPKKRLVFAVSKDKDYSTLIQLAAGYFDEILLCRYVGNPRGVETTTLVDQWDQVTAELRRSDRTEYPSPNAAFSHGKAISQPEDLLVVAGSVFLLGEV